jgi:hypothetical protein
MNARSIRRAAERKAQKELRKAENAYDNSVEAFNQVKTELSNSQLAANRANAQLSTGPRTEEGKQKSALNAVKTGLTGVTVLLPADDAAHYERHILRFFTDHQPAGERESELTQSMADAQWRLNRIPGLEMAIFARGRIQFAEQYADYDNQTAAALMDAETLIVYHKQLRNLATQEGRLRRQYEKDRAELDARQAARAEAAKATATNPHPIGFEFANTTSLNSDAPIAQPTKSKSELTHRQAA